NPKLLQQHYPIRLHIVRQHTNRIRAYKQLTADLRTHTAIKHTVLKPQLFQTIKTLITLFALQFYNLSIHSFLPKKRPLSQVAFFAAINAYCCSARAASTSLMDSLMRPRLSTSSTTTSTIWPSFR